MRLLKGNWKRKMAMRFVAGVCITILSCGTARQASQQAIAIEPGMQYVADGDNKEWPVPYPFIDNKNKIQYAIANNRTTLFITVKSSDAISIRKLERHGLILFIDTAAGKNQTTELIALAEPQIPSSVHQEDAPQESNMLKENTGASDTKPVLQGVLPVQLQQIALIGFCKNNGNFRPPYFASNSGIKVSAGINELNEMIWEIELPFSLFLKDSILYVDSGRHISVGIFMPALGAADMPVMNSPQAADGSNSTAGHSAGSRPPGGGGRGTPANDGEQDAAAYQDKMAEDMDRLTKNALIWRRVTLSYTK